MKINPKFEFEYQSELYLKEIQSLMKNKQDDMNSIRELSENVLSNASRYRHEIANLKEILETSEDIKRRYKDIMSQVLERFVYIINFINYVIFNSF